MSALIMALMSAAVLGVADFLGGVASRRAPAVTVTLTIMGVALLGVTAAILTVAPASWERADLLWGAAAGLGAGVGLPLFYYGLASGAMSVVAPITAITAAAVPVIFGFALGERPSPAAAAGVALGILAIALIAYRAPEPGDVRPARTRGVVIALVAGLGFGAFYVLLARTGPSSGLAPLVATRFSAIAILLVAALAMRAPITPRLADTPVLAAAGLLDSTGSVLFLFAVHRGPLALVGILASLYPVATILLARAIHGERMTRLQLVGLACAVLAVGLIVSG